MSKFLVVLFFSLSAFGDAVVEKPDHYLVTMLKKTQAYEAHLFHADRLWVGKDKGLNHPKHRIEVFDAKGEKLLDTQTLSHTVSHIYAYQKDSILVMGKSFTDQWRTHYSIIRVVGNAVKKTKTHTFPVKYQVDQFGGTPSFPLFSEPGSRSVYRMKFGTLRRFGGDMYFPSEMTLTPKYVFVREGHGPGLMDETLVRINRVTEKMERTFDHFKNGLTKMLYLPSRKEIVISETREGNLLFIDEEENKLNHTIEKLGNPRGLISFGSCIAVVSEWEKLVSFIDISSEVPQHFHTWDMSDLGEASGRPHLLAANMKDKIIFIRSTFMCPSCQDSGSSVFAVQVKNETVLNRCGLN